MSKRHDKDYLLDILEGINRIFEYTNSISYEQFLEQHLIQDGVIRNIEIIGEASKNLPEDIIKSYYHIPWSDLAKMRDKLIHHYFGVNFDIVWGVIKESLPQIEKQIREITSDLE